MTDWGSAAREKRKGKKIAKRTFLYGNWCKEGRGELEAASLVCNSRSNKNLYCLEWRSRRSWVYCATIRKEEGRGGSCCCRYIPPPSYCTCRGRSEFSSSSSSHPVPMVLYCTASSLLQLWQQEKHYIVQLGGILGRYAVFIHGKNVVVFVS